MSYETWNKQLAKCSALFKAGQPVWYRRPYFTDPNFKGMQPKWHIFKDRQQPTEDRLAHTWVAQCGYTFDFLEVLLSVPQLKLGKAKPLVKDRCTKCTAAAAKLSPVPPTK